MEREIFYFLLKNSHSARSFVYLSNRTSPITIAITPSIKHAAAAAAHVSFISDIRMAHNGGNFYFLRGLLAGSFFPLCWLNSPGIKLKATPPCLLFLSQPLKNKRKRIGWCFSSGHWLFMSVFLSIGRSFARC